MKKYLSIAIAGIILTSIHASFVGKEPVDKAELGKLLFFDPILSKDKTISCASCHIPGLAFADSAAVSKGVGGATGSRNTPSAMNLSLQRVFFWDGRAKSLEDQALAPIENPVEMNLPVSEAVIRLRENQECRNYFQKIFNSDPNRENLAESLAAFERTLETTESPFDQWKFSGDPLAVNDAVKRGFDLFNGKGKCIQCHFGADFTTNEFKNIGLFDGYRLNDSGRILITGISGDLGRFKVPALRNIAITAPYMHNGIFKTLREVIDFYNDPDKIVPKAMNRDTILARPLGLSEYEKNDLESFLRALTDKRFSNTSNGVSHSE